MKDIKKSQQVTEQTGKRKADRGSDDPPLLPEKNIKLWKNIMDCARSVKNSETMPQCVWINVRFMETKTFCSNCRVHCYKPQMREEIRNVMRFAGPRMLFYHPIMAIRHVITSAKEKKRMGRKETYD